MNGDADKMAGNIMEELAGLEDNFHLPNIPLDQITTQQLYVIMMAQNTKMQVVLRHVLELQQEQKKIIEAQRDMLETWKTAGNILKFIKMVGSLGTAIAGVIGLAYLIKSGGAPHK